MKEKPTNNLRQKKSLVSILMSGHLPCVSDTSTPQCYTKAKRIELSEPVKRREEPVRQSFLESNGDKALMERVSRKLAKGKK